MAKKAPTEYDRRRLVLKTTLTAGGWVDEGIFQSKTAKNQKGGHKCLFLTSASFEPVQSTTEISFLNGVC